MSDESYCLKMPLLIIIIMFMKKNLSPSPAQATDDSKYSYL